MIYLHYKSRAHIYPPNPDDIYLYFSNINYPCCDGNCSTCPLVNKDNCASEVRELLKQYPDPTILTPDTHPEIFL